MPTDLVARDLTCPDCGGRLVLRTFPEWGKKYVCLNYPVCKGGHGANQKTGAPLGVPADYATRRARMDAHAALDRIVALTGKARAYRWLATVLKMEQVDCHIGQFDEAQCQRVIGAVNTYTRGNHG